MDLDSPIIPAVLLHAVDHPVDRPAQCLAQHRPTGLADGRQPFERPRTRTVTAQLSHQNAVRQEDQVHVAAPGSLAATLTEMTIAPLPGVLLAVPVEALGALPSPAVHTENAGAFPLCSVGHEYLSRGFVAAMFPQNDDPQRVIHAVDADGFGEVPLFVAVDLDELAIFGWDQRRQFLGMNLLSPEDHVTVHGESPFLSQ